MSTIHPVECAACHRENDPWRRFCGRCGSALPNGCTTCAAVNRHEDRFCGSCGGPLRAAVGTNGFRKQPPAPPKPSKPAVQATMPIDVRDVLPQD